MSAEFTSVCNHNERAVFERVVATAPSHAGLADQPGLLADVACVALNRLAPRYIRHHVDYVFYLSDRERNDNERAITEAVEYAFGFVQARVAMKSRV